MKIVFEFYGKTPQLTFSGEPYCVPVMEPPRYIGGRVEGLIVDSPTPAKPDPESDALYIEGDLEVLRNIFEQALAQLEVLAIEFRAEAQKRLARSRQCPACSMWFDTRFNDNGHGDGRGMMCLGDGTALLSGDREVIVERDGASVDARLSSLNKGERFRLKEPYGEQRDFEAIDDAIVTDDALCVRVHRDP